MTLYAIVDEDMQIMTHVSKGTLGVFKSIGMLKKHAWRYTRGKEWMIAELDISQAYKAEEEAR